MCDWWNTLRWPRRRVVPQAKPTSGSKVGDGERNGWKHSSGGGDDGVHEHSVNGYHRLAAVNESEGATGSVLFDGEPRSLMCCQQ